MINFLNSGLVQSTETINSENLDIYKKMEKDFADPIMNYRVARWLTKVKAVRSYSQELINLIETIKAGIEHELNKQDASELKQQFGDYLKKISQIDSTATKIFTSQVNLFSNPVDSTLNNGRNWLIYGSKSSRLAVLSKLENRIAYIENILVTYFSFQYASYDDRIFVYRPLIHQNGKHLVKDDELVIQAGVGGYYSERYPEIVINGKKVTLEDNAVGSYKMHVTGSPGKYKVPIRITYMDERNQETIVNEVVEYYIDN